MIVDAKYSEYSGIAKRNDRETKKVSCHLLTTVSR